MQYFVDAPKKLREQGFLSQKLHLLRDVFGALRPGVLTALMGASGAGKTTLLDVLFGRKTGGYIERDIMVEGYPKVQQTYARVSGFCEQTDVHSLFLTLWELVMFSAWLHLPKDIPKVLQMIELDEIKDALVSVTSVSGLSAE
ncbi:hypothetical protein Gohar_017194 [Gossypium harknessii]|uniref:ABC transporter domain-containing protein n=1 Tax=Gossypium harknessii TaxID=34285 RepID=A0A7J9G571_9ROSI|nr:hypothetical protein [Gossypium harknessii]